MSVQTTDNVRRDLIRQVESWAALEPDWDSYDADPTTPAAIAAAKMLLFGLEELPPMIGPSRDGGVTLRWPSVRWIMVRPDGNLTVYAYRVDGEPAQRADITL